MGVFGSAPFMDQIGHLFHGPQFTPGRIHVGDDSAMISGHETFFRVPLTRDTVAGVRGPLKWRSPVGMRDKKLDLQEGKEKVFHDGRMYGVERDDKGRLAVTTSPANFKTRFMHGITSPSTLVRLGAAGVAGAIVDLSVVTAVGSHDKKHQKKIDQQQMTATAGRMELQNQRAMQNPGGMQAGATGSPSGGSLTVNTLPTMY